MSESHYLQPFHEQCLAISLINISALSIISLCIYVCISVLSIISLCLVWQPPLQKARTPGTQIEYVLFSMSALHWHRKIPSSVNLLLIFMTLSWLYPLSPGTRSAHHKVPPGAGVNPQASPFCSAWCLQLVLLPVPLQYHARSLASSHLPSLPSLGLSSLLFLATPPSFQVELYSLCCFGNTEEATASDSRFPAECGLGCNTQKDLYQQVFRGTVTLPGFYKSNKLKPP